MTPIEQAIENMVTAADYLQAAVYWLGTANPSIVAYLQTVITNVANDVKTLEKEDAG